MGMEAAKAIQPIPEPESSRAAQPKSRDLATTDGRVLSLKALARKIEQRIQDVHSAKAAFNSEAKELRETLKQIAAEMEGRGDAGSQESALVRIRQILREEE
jgi:hypothetical protein